MLLARTLTPTPASTKAATCSGIRPVQASRKFHSICRQRLYPGANLSAVSQHRSSRVNIASFSGRFSRTRKPRRATQTRASAEGKCPIDISESASRPSLQELLHGVLATVARGLLTVASFVAPAMLTNMVFPHSLPSIAKYACMLVASAIGGSLLHIGSQFVHMLKYKGVNVPEMVKEGNYPFVGHSFQMFDKAFPSRMREQYGDIYCISLPTSPDPVVQICSGPEVLRLLGEEGVLVESHWPTSMVALMGFESVFGAKGDKHKLARRIMNGALGERAVMSASGSAMIQSVLDKHVAEWTSRQGEVDMVVASKRLTCEVTLRYVLGVEVSAAKFEDIMVGLSKITAALPTPDIGGLPFGPHHQGMKARGRMVEVMQDVVDEFMAMHQAGTASNGFLKQMMDMAAAESTELDALFIMDNVILMLWAGTDTTATTLVTMLMKLQSHPEVYTRLRSDLDADANSKYARACVVEVNRMAGIVNAVFRRTLVPVEVLGRTIPKGWTLILQTQNLTMDALPGVLENEPPADVFCPERWGGGGRLPEQHLPWGGGSRICVGRALALVELERTLRMLVTLCDFNVLHNDHNLPPSPAFAIMPATLRMDIKPRGYSASLASL